ncbi:alpha/beta fold hydrolase [Flavobacterium sp.]|uniref:alpha/beta fold hydrolase n=1 Tax=Flavobacterium sp. TaxID=239 RepID=UPI003BDBB4D6
MEKTIQKIVARSIGSYINLLSYIAPNKSLLLAYKFFSEPRKGKIKGDKIPKTLQKSIYQKHKLNNQEFYTYRWEGNKEVILLVHGWESNASRWKKLLPYLKKTGKTIIAIDAPAHGFNTDKEFNVIIYSEFINEIVQKFHPKIAIGHSIGGNALAYYQNHYPHQIEKMVLLGAPCDFKVIMENYFILLSLNKKVQKQFKDYIQSRFNIAIEDFSASKFLKETTISGIIAHDLEDSVVLFKESTKIASAWKTAQFIETKGFGHSMHDANLYQTIVEFLES